MSVISEKKAEVLRYLGYRNQKIDNMTDRLIDEAINEIKELAKERYIYKIFSIDRENNELSLYGSKLILDGNDIKKHLGKSQDCILMAATLGHDVDTRIRYYEKTSMTKAVILDACATATIEEVCDKICREIENGLQTKNKRLTYRYSPGYGDLPIHMQNDFLLTLDARKSIGLTASSHSILIPRKSVTAIVGIIDMEEPKEKKSCISCNKYNTCIFSKGGNGCGN